MTPLSSRTEDADDRRSQVLEVAARVLAEDGPHGLSLRRIATEAGSSTQIVYTLFGGKPGLADALYAEGFRRLGVRMAAALDDAPPPGDPVRLIALGEGYRRFALEEPAFFAVMFGRAVPGFTPARSTRAEGRSQTLGQVVRACQECLDAGTLVAPDATTLARACWATAHGVAALEVAGLLAPEGLDAVVALALRAPVDAHRPS